MFLVYWPGLGTDRNRAISVLGVLCTEINVWTQINPTPGT